MSITERPGTATAAPGAGASPTHTPETCGLVGRVAELEQLRRCVRREPGAPHALLLLGEEGIGRTRLLRAAEEAARPAPAGSRLTLLTARGWAAERGERYAGLRQLLAPLHGPIQALAEPHRGVLRAVLSLEPDDGRPRAAVLAACAALLGPLGPLGPQGRVLVSVDDAHDCDPETVELLGALIRLPGEGRPTVLFASRDGEVLVALPSEVDVLHLEPLSLRESAELLDGLPGAPEGRRRLELLDEAHGNPAALRELCRAWAAQPERVTGGEDFASLHRLGGRMAARLARLPEPTRRALAAAALGLPDDDTAVLMTALGTSDPAVWAPAEEAGIVSLVDGRVVFHHPLARAAAAAGQPALERHRVHRRLAELAVDRPLDRARHWAAASLGPDASVAAELAAGARAATDAYTAARALEDAARLSGTPEQHAEHLSKALQAAREVGDPQWVLDLHTRLSRGKAGRRHRRRAALAAADALSLTGRQKDAFRLLEEAAEQSPPEDATAVAEMLAALAAIAEQSGLARHREAVATMVGRAGDAVQAAVGGARPGGVDAAALTAYAEAVVGVPGSARRNLRRLESPRPNPRPDAAARTAPLIARGSVAQYADEPETCLEHFRVADLLLRARRAFGRRAHCLAPLLDTLLDTGRWPEAEVLLDEAADKAALLRLPRVLADLDALRAALGALRGAQPPLPAPRDPRLWLDLDENAATRARVVRADGLAALARGDWDDAFRRLRALFDQDGTPVHPLLAPRAVAELALAAQRAGRTGEAAPVLARVRETQGERPTTRMTLLLHHATALVDPGPAPEHHYQLALVNADGERWPLERAQARLSYAIWLRRGRRLSEARQQLAAALETAERLGAGTLTAWIRHELRASGVATEPAPGTGTALAELTAQQQQIVRMAAEGLSNREIGEQLFLSPRTVGTHLYNVYPKLGVTRRHQLRDLLQHS